MTRRNFEALANHLKNSRPMRACLTSPRAIDDYSSRLYQWRLSISVVADACRESNPRFKRDLFLRASGFNED